MAYDILIEAELWQYNIAAIRMCERLHEDPNGVWHGESISRWKHYALEMHRYKIMVEEMHYAGLLPY